MAWGDLAVDSQSLELTPSVQQGLIAISVLASISFVSSSIIFLYLSYKLIWHLCRRKHTSSTAAPSSAEAAQQPKSFQHRVDFALGIDGIFAENDHDDLAEQERHADRSRRGSSFVEQAKAPSRRQRPQPPNQFLILIFNLLLADMHQGVAFLLNFEWLRYGLIRVGTPTCFVQGLFVSTGDLASSCFITTIAVHTYLSVVQRYMMPHKVLYLVIVCVWVFVYAISGIPIATTQNGAEYGGFFVRAGAWCWMNISYKNLRLLTHYLFIFIALGTTSALYATIFISLRRQTRDTTASSSSHTGSTASVSASASAAHASHLQLSHNPAFLIYPVIYVLCTLPLALGRISSIIGADPPLGYMCFAGAMISSNGMFDCMLFGTTRNVIVFASKHDVDRSNTGLDTFNFMKTPRARRYGNMVWVQGGGGKGAGSGSNARHEGTAADREKTTSGWWQWWQRLGRGGGRLIERPERGIRGHRRTGSRSVSQESLRGPTTIQMDTVTTVVVERDKNLNHDPRYPDLAGSAGGSMNSTDKGYLGSI